MELELHYATEKYAYYATTKTKFPRQAKIIFENDLEDKMQMLSIRLIDGQTSEIACHVPTATPQSIDAFDEAQEKLVACMCMLAEQLNYIGQAREAKRAVDYKEHTP